MAFASACLLLVFVVLCGACTTAGMSVNVTCVADTECSLNGKCDVGGVPYRTATGVGVCLCDAPWSGPQCALLPFASASPAAGRDLYHANDTAHNTWNGPMVFDGTTYHMYVALYPAGLLYHPVALMHGQAASRYGPFTWNNLTGVDVSINPGALVYKDALTGVTRYTIWTSKVDGASLGAVFTSDSPAGPFTEIANSNSTGCYINPSPLYNNGAFFCTGQKGTTIMTASAIGGPWSAYATIPHAGEDPFLWVDRRGNWHALFHASGGATAHCGNSTVAAHYFSGDAGKTWGTLDNAIEPYKPRVVWDDAPAVAKTYASMERPHLYFDSATGAPSHLGVAAPLNIGDEGCPNAWPGCKGRRNHTCPCCNCKYVSHAGSLLVTLASQDGH